MTVSKHQMSLIRARGFQNVGPLVRAAERAEIILAGACALIEKESHGRNVYGNDEGGMAEGFKGNVTQCNFEMFWHMVLKGHRSNGVGPAQITSRDLLHDMLINDLKPWDPEDNMFYGFQLIEEYKKDGMGSWEYAGRRYNGSALYGAELALGVKKWRNLLEED